VPPLKIKVIHCRTAGAKEIMPMTDMFFVRARGGSLTPFGNVWTIAKEEVVPEEMQRRMMAQGYYLSALANRPSAW
jgi:hypothetical protein